VAPRAHPNDGRFDVVEIAAGMRLRERWEARRRLPTGTHVPHPSISVRTATSWGWSDPAGAHVWVDGVDIGQRTAVDVTIRPDAAAVHV
jgi:diacylglycerol kinase family enzyme